MQRCQVCANKRVSEIDKRIVKGADLAKLAREFSISYSAMYRHAREHISRQLATGAEVALKNTGVNLMTELGQLMNETREILEEARKKKHNGLALKAIQQIRGNLSLLAAIENEIYKQQMRMDGTVEELEQFRKKKEMNDRVMSSMSTTLTPLELEIYRVLNLKIISENQGWGKIKGIDYYVESEVMEEKRKRNEMFEDP